MPTVENFLNFYDELGRQNQKPVGRFSKFSAGLLAVLEIGAVAIGAKDINPIAYVTPEKGSTVAVSNDNGSANLADIYRIFRDAGTHKGKIKFTQDGTNFSCRRGLSYCEASFSLSCAGSGYKVYGKTTPNPGQTNPVYVNSHAEESCDLSVPEVR